MTKSQKQNERNKVFGSSGILEGRAQSAETGQDFLAKPVSEIAVVVVPVQADFYKPLFLPQGTKVVGVAVDPIRQCPVVFTVKDDGGEGQ